MAGLPEFLALVAVTAILAEVAWSRWRDRRVYNLRESLSNLGMMVINRLLRPLVLA